MIVQTSQVVSQPSKMNAAGWFVIVLCIIAFIIGGSVLGAGIAKAGKCDGMTRYENNYYYIETPEYRSCVNEAASLILGGIICLVVGGILSCVSCCACGGVGCFRDYEQVVVNSPVVFAAGSVPLQQQYVQAYAPGQTNGQPQGQWNGQPAQQWQPQQQQWQPQGQQQQQWQQQPVQGYPVQQQYGSGPQQQYGSGPQQFNNHPGQFASQQQEGNNNMITPVNASGRTEA